MVHPTSTKTVAGEDDVVSTMNYHWHALGDNEEHRLIMCEHGA
jgi:hypothetical protein